MSRDEAHVLDWRDEAAYAPLLQADRSVLAWEWLRRDPAYIAAAASALERRPAGGPADRRCGPGHWGLHVFEPPCRPAPNARPIWRAEVHPFVLGVRAERACAEGDTLDLARLAVESEVVTSPGNREHLLISDGLRCIRIDVVSGSVTGGPVRLHYLLAGFASSERPLLTLRRLIALRRTGRMASALRQAEAKARRSILMLRAHDAMARGAVQREIAAVLLGTEAAEPRWRVGAPTLRSRVQRLVRNARAMAAGGYLSLLRD